MNGQSRLALSRKLIFQVPLTKLAVGQQLASARNTIHNFLSGCLQSTVSIIFLVERESVCAQSPDSLTRHVSTRVS